MITSSKELLKQALAQRTNNDFTRLSKLSDVELVKSLESLRATEHKATVEILLHLIEVESRKLHLSFGYPSLFEYCRFLGYSDAGAGRRITAARCIRNFPEVYGLLVSNQVNLSTISVFASILTSENKDIVLGQVSGRSRREVEVIVSNYKPRVEVQDRVTVLENGMETFDSSLALETLSLLNQCMAHSAGESELHESTAESDARYKIEFAVGEEFLTQLKHLKELCSGKFPEGAKLEEIFLEVMLEYLDRHSPKRKALRRQKQATEKPNGDVKEVKPEPPAEKRQTLKEHLRYIPEAMKGEVYLRDGGQCTYVGKSGIRCCSRKYLEFDHIIPFPQGGRTEFSNLRLLCSAHNLLEAETKLGKTFMQQFYERVAA